MGTGGLAVSNLAPLQWLQSLTRAPRAETLAHASTRRRSTAYQRHRTRRFAAKRTVPARGHRQRKGRRGLAYAVLTGDPTFTHRAAETVAEGRRGRGVD